ncbi:hypothetical protein JHD49_01215 [Sulfurimonas sp. SAG-AH-194-C21]|nr:hypothetical protein [Sulfurimonas sp. SAG-AH-194-C21]MDF1882553.1 hypothetical protein [Sulfurimonas sp. SAG-AH-194-C21]
MKNLIKITATLLLLGGLNSASAMDLSKADIGNGAAVWSDVCMRCHNVRLPEDLNKRAWEYSMNHMRIRAGLTGQETRDILAFILASKTKDDAHN